MIKSFWILATVLCLLIINPLNAQNSADLLYQAVINLQLELGNGPDADAIRDNLGIRELETESARGYNANPEILQVALNQFTNSGQEGENYQNVRKAIALHLNQINQSYNLDFQGSIAGMTSELEPVAVESLERSRQRLIGTLQRLDQYNRIELSNYGRRYLDNRLGLPALLDQLEQVKFEPPTDPEQTRPYVGRLVALRSSLAATREKFGLASTEYGNQFVARGESEIRRMERQMFAFLLPRATRTFAAVKAQLEKRLRIFKSKDGVLTDPQDRLFQSELGRWLGVFSERAQKTGFDALARRLYSKPNLKISIRENLANRLASQTVSEVDHVDEVILGNRAQGFSYTSGAVTLDFIDNPHSAFVSVNLAGNVSSNTYTKEGRVTAYTSSGGGLYASRGLVANVGNISVMEPRALASITSQFRGTNCIPLVERIAFGQYMQKKARAEEIASERAQQRLLDRFTQQTDEALGEGLEQAEELKGQRSVLINRINQFRFDFSQVLAQDKQGVVQKPIDMVDQFILPRLAVSTTHDELHVHGLLEGVNRLAAGSDPPPAVGPVDVRMQIHESMVANAIAPLIQGRTLENWKFPQIVEGLSSREAIGLDRNKDRPFAIQFMQGRPIQFEFEDNEIGISVFGQEFRRQGDRFVDPIKISIRFRIVDRQGKLFLIRSGRPVADFVLPVEEGERRTQSIAFRQFLQDNLDDAVEGDPMEQAIELPPNLIPMDQIDNEEARQRLKDAQLVELTSDNGWLTLGWNYRPGDHWNTIPTVNTPAIWYGTDNAAPPEPAEGQVPDDKPGDDQSESR